MLSTHPLAKRKLLQGTEVWGAEGSAGSHTDAGGVSLVSTQWPSLEVDIARRATRKDSIKQ